MTTKMMDFFLTDSPALAWFSLLVIAIGTPAIFILFAWVLASA